MNLEIFTQIKGRSKTIKGLTRSFAIIFFSSIRRSVSYSCQSHAVKCSNPRPPAEEERQRGQGGREEKQ